MSSQPSPVFTATKRGTAFLEIVSHEKGVRVQRTAAGRTLNSFWTYWLRGLILEKGEPRFRLAVEARDTSVLVSGKMSQEGLTETVRALASRIRPLPNPPMLRSTAMSTRSTWWHVADHVNLTSVVRELTLPGGARVRGGAGTIRLRREPSNPFTIGQLAQMVELHVALHYRPSSAPLHPH